MKRFLVFASIVLILGGLGGYLALERRSRWPDPVSPVTASGPEVALLDFASPFSLDSLPESWWHRRFITRPPMEVDWVERDGIHGLRCRTDDSGSIFGRFADITLSDHPILEWSWRVDRPLDTNLDERTREGDDHAARLYARFQTSEGTTRSMEIIWSNGVFQPGEYKYIGAFPHYVAQSGFGAVGQWVDESVDLERIYYEIWPGEGEPRLTYLAVFCDTDDTGSSSEAVFATVRLRSRGADEGP